MAKKSSSMENEKLVAILSYFLVGIIWYFVDKSFEKSKYVKYHVKVGLTILIFSILSNIIVGFLFFIPFVGSLIGTLITLFILFVWVYGLIIAIKEETKEVPFVSSIAERIFTF